MFWKKKQVRIDYVWYEVSEEGMHALAKQYQERLKRNRVEYYNLRDRHSHNQGRIKTTRVYKEMETERKAEIRQLEDEIDLLKNRIYNLLKHDMVIEVPKECTE